MMTQDQLIDWICVGLGDFSTQIKNRTRFLIPRAVSFVMYNAQWESMTVDRELSVTSGSYTNFPDDVFKSWCMYRSGLTKEITWIPPEQYDRLLADNSTPLGTEVSQYTVKGSENLLVKRFYWLDKPTGSYTIQGTFSRKIDVSAVQNIPEQFLDAIKAKLMLEVTPAWLKDATGLRLPNPNYGILYRSLIRAMGVLNSIEGGYKGRKVGYELDNVGKDATSYYHA